MKRVLTILFLLVTTSNLWAISSSIFRYQIENISVGGVAHKMPQYVGPAYAHIMHQYLKEYQPNASMPIYLIIDYDSRESALLGYDTFDGDLLNTGRYEDEKPVPGIRIVLTGNLITTENILKTLRHGLQNFERLKKRSEEVLKQDYLDQPDKLTIAQDSLMKILDKPIREGNSLLDAKVYSYQFDSPIQYYFQNDSINFYGFKNEEKKVIYSTNYVHQMLPVSDKGVVIFNKSDQIFYVNIKDLQLTEEVKLPLNDTTHRSYDYQIIDPENPNDYVFIAYSYTKLEKKENVPEHLPDRLKYTKLKERDLLLYIPHRQIILNNVDELINKAIQGEIRE